jgi:hypothetical protein
MRVVVWLCVALGVSHRLCFAVPPHGGASLLCSCFEVFGFDVLLDTQLRAWLLEVNTCPALNADSPLDMEVKTKMVRVTSDVWACVLLCVVCAALRVLPAAGAQ